MRLPVVSALLILIHSLAVPSALALALTPSLSPRYRFCYNAPTTIAGTLLTRHIPPPPSNPQPHPRTRPPTYLWCAPYSRTYIILTLTSLLPPPSSPLPPFNPSNPISHLLTLATSTTTQHLRLHGDGPLPNGGYDWMTEGVDLSVWNANNHQTTWGVLGAAVGAVAECMRVNGWGAGRFGIWDGGVEVGGGEIG